MSNSLTPSAPATGLSRNAAISLAVLLRAAASLAFALLLLAFLWDRTVNHDAAWYLISTRKWLEGARLYVDLYDVNPPLATYLTAPAIWLAGALGISDTNGFYAFFALLTGVSLFLSASILDRRIAPGRARAVLAFLGLGAVLTAPFLREFGQREQLMVLFVMPWLVGQIPARTGEPARPAARGLLAYVAAIGICIKPYFLTLPLAVLTWQMLRTRSVKPVVSPEILVMFVTGAAYVLATALFHPAFFSDAVPTARQVYLSFGFSDRIAATRLMLGVAAYLPFFALLATNRGALRIPGAIIAGVSGGLMCYLLQWNGFDYHLTPFLTFANLSVLWVLLQSPKGTPLFLGAVVTAGTVMVIALHKGTYDFRARPYIDAAMGDAPRPRSLFAATTSVDAGPLLALELGADWASRYPVNWTLPGALAGLSATDCAADAAACDGFRAILDRTRGADLDDIARFRPEMILVDKRNLFIADEDFSWYDFFAKDPRWPATIASYRRAGSTVNFDIWTLKAAEN